MKWRKSAGALLFPNLIHSRLDLWTGDQPAARPLRTHRATQTQNKRTQTSIPPVGFEPTISVLELGKTARPL
jgi:hypothetical protein